jgi:hypothetical protein
MGISSVWDDFINSDVSLGLEALPGAGFESIEDTLNSCLTFHTVNVSMQEPFERMS